MIKVYTIGCPSCNILEKKLTQKNIEYVTINDVAVFKDLGIYTFPMLQIDDNPLLSYIEAIDWVNHQEG